MRIHPSGRPDGDPNRETSQRELLHSRRRWPEYRCQPADEKEQHKSIKTDAADAILRASASQVDKYSKSEQSDLDDDRGTVGIPKPQAHLGGEARSERHVGAMDDHIQDPVADNERAQHPCPTFRAAKQNINAGEDQAPDDVGEKTVRIGIKNEIQGCCAGDSGRYPDLFDPGEDQDRPQYIRELSCEHQCAQRSLWRGFLRRECDSVMANKHRRSAPRDCPKLLKSQLSLE